jgi:hypothetical protein
MHLAMECLDYLADQHTAASGTIDVVSGGRSYCSIEH